MRLPRMTTRRLVLVAIVVVSVSILAGVVHNTRQRWARAEAERHEAKVRELVNDEPLANMSLDAPPRDGVTGFLYYFGIQGPHRRRGERRFITINPIDPKKGLTRTAGPTIDACRVVPDGMPAELWLSRKVLIPDPLTTLGPYSSRSKGDFRRMKDIDLYTYGNLDVGIREGVLVVIRVR
jgi:hypothetical protein